MNTVIKVIGVIFILTAIGYIAKPTIITAMLTFFIKGKRLYLAAMLRFALAIVFLLSARECDIPWLIAALGVMFLLAGMLLLIINLEKLKEMLTWWLEKPPSLLRLLAIVTLIFGAFIVYAA